MASHLLMNIRVSLDDGVAPGLIPLNCSIDYAHAKAHIEHVAVAFSSRADGLQDEGLQAFKNKTIKPQPAAAMYQRGPTGLRGKGKLSATLGQADCLAVSGMLQGSCHPGRPAKEGQKPAALWGHCSALQATASSSKRHGRAPQIHL